MTDVSEVPFNPGQVVVFNSGGGRMTVVRCHPAADLADERKYPSGWAVNVQWVQDDGTFHDRLIDAALLTAHRSQWQFWQDMAQQAAEERREG